MDFSHKSRCKRSRRVLNRIRSLHGPPDFRPLPPDRHDSRLTHPELAAPAGWRPVGVSRPYLRMWEPEKHVVDGQNQAITCQVFVSEVGHIVVLSSQLEQQVDCWSMFCSHVLQIDMQKEDGRHATMYTKAKKIGGRCKLRDFKNQRFRRTNVDQL